MFLNEFKEIWTKKNIKKQLLNVKHLASSSVIIKVAILIDETYFHEKDALIAEIKKNGIQEENISLLVFKNVIKKNDFFRCASYSYKNLSWLGTINKKEVSEFAQQEFDLLINYYDTKKSPLLLVTNLSKAKFKVGFASSDKRLNHFMVNTNAENYKLFLVELFKYLKILNKL
ncbi:DUF6913 domain-containing protein [Flavobacterium sp.]|jgi:hypothetical protein|uniref:DUF6913 domain-containing protein n=1 Tax=Flavobacterium sp. TaxID=239 RepID=UPI003BBCE5AE